MIGLHILFSIAGVLTSAWLGGALVYVSRSLGWGALMDLPPTDMALLVFAVLGPLAALWLVVGFIQNALGTHRQERVLQTLAAQARQTAGQTEGQVRTLIQMQQESRRRSLIDGMDLVLKDLNGQAATLAERLGMVSQDEADTLWARTVSGDVWAFAYAFLTRAAAYPEFPDLLAERLAQDDISASALQIFRRRYDMLVTSFEHADADKVVRSVLEDGPLARLHDLFIAVDERATRLRLGGGWAPTPDLAAAGGVAAAAAAAASVMPEPEPEPAPAPVFQPEPEVEPAPAPEVASAPFPEPDTASIPLPDFGEDPFEPEGQDAPAPGPRFTVSDAPVPPEAEEGPPFTPLAVEGESMDQSMARLQDALRRMHAADGVQDPAGEPALQDTAASSDSLSEDEDIDQGHYDLLSRLALRDEEEARRG